jgi:hypothetical protein
MEKICIAAQQENGDSDDSDYDYGGKESGESKKHKSYHHDRKRPRTISPMPLTMPRWNCAE